MGATGRLTGTVRWVNIFVLLSARVGSGIDTVTAASLTAHRYWGYRGGYRKLWGV